MADSKKTVLIVDDEADLRDTLTLEFELSGYQVLSADTAPGAISILKNERVDAVISDIRLPGQSGLELLSFINSMEKDRPSVVLISGTADSISKEALENGAAAVLSKPFELGHLVDAVQKTLG